MKIISFLFLILISFSLNAQQVLKGELKDKATKEPLAFAAVWAIKSKTNALADLHGKYSLKITVPNDSILIQYVGYKPLKFTANNWLPVLYLEEADIVIETTTILAGENQAYRHIRNAIENRDLNDPEKYDAFTYNSYNKVLVFPDFLSKDKKNGIESFFSKTHLMFWESVTERKYKKPGKTTEKVIASKASGLPGYALPFSPTELQDLSFYKNWVKVLGIENLSPIAKTAISNYEYHMKDTLIDGNDTIFSIKFLPRNQNKTGFTGILKLHTKKYNIVSIQAEMDVPVEQVLIKSIKIQQLYQPKKDSLWFPYQLNTDLTMNMSTTAKDSADTTKGTTISTGGTAKNDSVPLAYFKFNVESHLKDIEINPQIKNNEFKGVELEVDENAALPSEELLNKYRTDSLTEKEKNTYRVIDSLGNAAGTVKLIKGLENLAEGYLKIKMIDLDIASIYGYNKIEGSRLGFGVRTNDDIAKWFKVGAWFGYGFKDKKMKRGGYLNVHPFKNKNIRFTALYQYNILESGANRLNLTPYQYFFNKRISSLDERLLFVQQMDYVEQMKAVFYFPTLRFMSHSVGLNIENVTPAFDYTYQGQKYFKYTEVFTEARIAFGERYNKISNTRKIIASKYPVLLIRLTEGKNDFLDGRYKYQKFEASLSQNFNLHGWGKMFIQANAGQATGNLPYGKNFAFKALGKPSILSEKTSFNTMRMGEFVADQFLSGHLIWTIYNKNFPSKKYNPDFSFMGSYGIGTIKSTLEHSFILNAPTKGYYEAGLAITNILPQKWSKISPALQFIGVGAFYRMGAYSYKDPIQNVNLKLFYSFF